MFFVGSCRRPEALVECWRGRPRRSATAQYPCRASSAIRYCTECAPALELVTMLILKPKSDTNTARGGNPHPFIIIRLSWRGMNRSASRRPSGNPL